MLIFEATHGAEDPERANLPFIRGNVAAAAGQDAAVYLSADAVWLATPGGGTDIRYGGHPAVAEMAASLLANGGQVWVSAESAASRALGGDDLIAGAEIVALHQLSQLLMSGATTIRG
ncbi:MAG: DsrE family protein [Acidimicrobiales bacterium]